MVAMEFDATSKPTARSNMTDASGEGRRDIREKKTRGRRE